jgi:hypothetical protein
VEEIKKRLDQELADGLLAAEQEKILRSMRRHWEGLTVFVEHPQVPMDNNAFYAASGITSVVVVRP